MRVAVIGERIVYVQKLAHVGHKHAVAVDAFRLLRGNNQVNARELLVITRSAIASLRTPQLGLTTST